MAERRDIAKRHGLPPEFAEQLVGETAEQLEAFAAAVAAVRRLEAPPPVNEAELKALDALESKAAGQRRALGFEDASED